MTGTAREKPPTQILHSSVCRYCGESIQQWERLGQCGSWMHAGGTVYCTVTYVAEPAPGRA